MKFYENSFSGMGVILRGQTEGGETGMAKLIVAFFFLQFCERA